MRVRAAAFVLLVLLATACSGKRTRIADPQSLRILNHLSAKQSSFGVILDAKTGKALAAFPVNNPISAAIPDGRGGWFIGGGSCCSEAQSSLGALDAKTGAVDRTWRPRVDSASLEGGGVYLLAGNGSGIIVGGVFKAVDGVRRAAVAEIDSKTGRLVRRWQPRISGGSCPWCALFAAQAGGN